MPSVKATTTITPRYQVHIPVKIREAIGMTTHGKAEITAKDGKIIIKPVKESEIMKLVGSIKVKTPKGIDIDNIRDYIDYSDI